MRWLLLILFAGPLYAQSIDIAGGQSTVNGTAGAGGTFYFADQTVYLGGGKGIGFSDKFKWNGYDVIAGDAFFGYSIDGAGISESNRGLQIAKKTDHRTVAVFAGLTGLSYAMPFFTSMYQAKYPGAGFYVNQKYKRFTFSSLDVFARRKNIIQSAKYDGKIIQFYGYGGILNSAWTSGATFVFKPTPKFCLVGSESKQLDFSSESVSVSSAINFLNLSASAIKATQSGLGTKGESASIGAHWKLLRVASSYYNSNGHQQVLNSLTEQIEHWSLTEAINNKNQFQYGASYHRNAFAVSFNHSIIFEPGLGYQQILNVAISFHIHDTGLSTSAYMLPGHKFKYQLNGDDWLQGPLEGRAGAHQSTKGIGKNVIQGMVVDEKGIPMEGVAIQVGKKAVVFTNHSGIFEFRTRSSKQLPIAVDLDQSLIPGEWEIVSQTASLITLKRR
jgi:hypothetical protein